MLTVSKVLDLGGEVVIVRAFESCQEGCHYSWVVRVARFYIQVGRPSLLTVSKVLDSGVEVRRRRFEPQNHPRWRIVEISNRPPNLFAKQFDTCHVTCAP